jgi:hypothetical protein
VFEPSETDGSGDTDAPTDALPAAALCNTLTVTGNAFVDEPTVSVGSRTTPAVGHVAVNLSPEIVHPVAAVNANPAGTVNVADHPDPLSDGP